MEVTAVTTVVLLVVADYLLTEETDLTVQVDNLLLTVEMEVTMDPMLLV